MTNPFLSPINASLALSATEQPADTSQITETGSGALSSWFAVTDLASASITAASQQLALLSASAGKPAGAVHIDRRLASFWFASSIRPQGWQLPDAWDPIAGDYPTRDGWIRLHTNAPHHQRAALRVLGVDADKESVARTVETWDANDLQDAIVKANGCAARMSSEAEWSAHAQGKAVANEPLVHWQLCNKMPPKRAGKALGKAPLETASAPLTGVRVLDLTRVLAGPVGSRFMAGYGAEVLRIDPLDWDEPGVVPEVTLGKRCAGLDLKNAEDRQCFESLLGDADILLHGYRPGALEGLGYTSTQLRRLNPSLIEVCLCAYGWSGPWAARRGFDSLVQMSNGIAHTGMQRSGNSRPTPLPVQALDQATGYLLAAAMLRALRERATTGAIYRARLSLARTGALLTTLRTQTDAPGLAKETADDLSTYSEDTAWGSARRLRLPMQIEGIAPAWPYPANRLRSSAAQWLT